jgi:N-glycosylase/DNA lyase
MKIAVLNETIHAICAEVNQNNAPQQEWHTLCEEELMYEAAVCIMGSQTPYEMALATASHLRNLGLFQYSDAGYSSDEYEWCVAAALSEPIQVFTAGGDMRWKRPRLHRRSASMLAMTRANVYGAGMSIRQLLLGNESPRIARELLIGRVCGFGPKQASLFLRRIGFSSDLAVLDVHVIDYLRLVWDLNYQPANLARLPFYEHVEGEFRQIATSFGYSVGCVDLATWLTMRVAKREAYL